MKNKVLKLFTITGILSMSTLALSSCNSNSKDELVIWAWNKNVDALNKGIETYKTKVDPNFNARVESFARADIDKKFKTASQTNNYDAVADIALCDGFNMTSYYDSWSDIFIDLNDYVSNEERNNLVQSTLTSITYGDKLIALPLDVAPTVVFANRDLWDENKINDIQLNGWTWDEYLKIGKEIKLSKGNDITMTSYNMRGDDRIYRSMVSQKGEWLMSKDFEVQVGNQNSIDAMTKIKAMYDANVIGHIDTGDYKSLMKNNKIAAQIQGFFLGGQLKDIAPEMSGKWEVLPLPKWNETDEGSDSITGGSYLYANSKLNGESKEAAISFIKWMTLNKETSIDSLTVGGVYPALKTAYDTEYFKTTKDPYFNNKTVWKNVSEWSKNAKAIIATKYNGFNYDTFMKAQEKIIFTNEYESIQKELAEVARKMKNNAK